MKFLKLINSTRLLYMSTLDQFILTTLFALFMAFGSGSILFLLAGMYSELFIALILSATSILSGEVYTRDL